ncbi:MAG: antitoxin [Robiginitomaculum sp.]|nr:MAG: antitoxin [Robiginitomaculum sp.]
MEKVTAAEAKQKFGQMIDKAQRAPVQITKHGRGVAYLVSGADYEEEQRQKEFHLFSMLNRGLEDIKAGRTSSLEDVKAEIFKSR